MTDRSPFLTAREVADHLRVHVHTVYAMCERGQLDWLRTGPRGLRITRASVDRLLRRATVNPDDDIAATG